MYTKETVTKSYIVQFGGRGGRQEYASQGVAVQAFPALAMSSLLVRPARRARLRITAGFPEG
ncbi:hypothetical protein GCM10007886_26130 [Methylobacterium gregans]|uniref:Uncharacterized protein n=1 Tax=Methylobacterium gregans TaxID=374424 RepID=A0AA37MAS0_9HYPH|nr:hypothetical protein [Methylobacterium gregans]GJD78481.1 hypothetical protein NBEOAGPD_1696 [Methylobacterium gregans]GLS54430.1 hypothetical protein GCM10007886_26130 [Methylobacterium gregans]